MSDQVNLFTDLFEKERDKEVLRNLYVPLWKKITRFLIVFGLLSWSGAVIFFDFDIKCVEINCDRPVNIGNGKMYYESKTVKAEKVTCEYKDGNDRWMDCMVDGKLFSNCSCTNKDLKITSPYFNLDWKPSKNFLADHYKPPYKGYLDFESKRKYFDAEPEEIKSYPDFDEQFIANPLHGNERL